MKKFGLLLLTLLFLLCSCDVNSGVIARIEFSGTGLTASARHVNYDLSAVEGKEPAALPLLKNVDPKIDYAKLLAAFGMTGADYARLSNPSGRKYKLGGKTLIVYKAGFISFTDLSLYGKVNTMQPKQMADAATALAAQAGLSVSDLTFAESFDGTVVFTRTIDGTEAVGRTGMSATYNGDAVSGFSYLSSNYGDKQDVPLIGAAEAGTLLLTDKSSQSFGRETGVAVAAITDVIVTDVELVYWDSAYTQTQMRQTHIQPVYRFTGDCIDSLGNVSPFTGYVRAVSDNLTTDFFVDPETVQ